MFKTLRSLTGAIERAEKALLAVEGAVHALVLLRSGDGDLEERLHKIEASKEVWEASVEGLLMKAEGQYKAAAAAEGRAKTRQKNAELEDDDGDSIEEFAANYRMMMDHLSHGDQVPLPLNDQAPKTTGRAAAMARKRARRGGG